jgi:hypothetical protein
MRNITDKDPNNIHSNADKNKTGTLRYPLYLIIENEEKQENAIAEENKFYSIVEDADNGLEAKKEVFTEM